MRKIIAIALTAAACGASLAFTAGQAAAADHGPRCVMVRKNFTKGEYRYLRLTNLCGRRTSCYIIVIPHAKDPHGRLLKGQTKDVRYGTTQGPKALFVKNTSCSTESH
ncbi:hypothetical protein [Streptomyces natalensis]|uniref:Beta-Ig-H3/fasciclin n=1 Tax=Streptomyces natalensis ATCC 27448 TaxID=1240678 RepID=A0A0D7CH19_9ACTN|nr:hypothetical protein [Streptomyces natalensis]KIZ15170.1 hypothetical protein SNA_26585 [Streptomyces natalensis ATCC 27448]